MPAEAEAGAGRRIGKLCIALACRVRALAAGGKSVEIAMSDDGTIAPVREEPGAGGDRRTAEIAEHERQFREILEYCPAGLNVVDEDGRLLFHNARLRRLMGYDEEELHLFDTKRFWDDLDHRTPTPKGEANGNYKTGEHRAELREARRLVRAIHRPRGCPHEPRRVTAAPIRAHVNARVQAGAPPVSPRPRRAGGGSRGAR